MQCFPFFFFLFSSLCFLIIYLKWHRMLLCFAVLRSRGQKKIWSEHKRCSRSAEMSHKVSWPRGLSGKYHNQHWPRQQASVPILPECPPSSPLTTSRSLVIWTTHLVRAVQIGLAQNKGCFVVTEKVFHQRGISWLCSNGWRFPQ